MCRRTPDVGSVLKYIVVFVKFCRLLVGVFDIVVAFVPSFLSRLRNLSQESVGSAELQILIRATRAMYPFCDRYKTFVKE